LEAARLARRAKGRVMPPKVQRGGVTGPELSPRSYILCGTAKGRILLDIGIIGAGNIGATAARLFAGAGHRVAISNSRGPETLRGLVSEIGESARAVTVDEAAGFGEVVVLAVPWSRREEGLPSAGLLVDKIVIDAINPYTPDFRIEDLGDDTSSEDIVRRLPGARIVKAFNTMYCERLRDEGDTNAPAEDRLALFVAGDDAEAKAVVSRLIEDIGFAPVDTGSLREGGRKQQPGSSIYNIPLSAGPAAREAGLPSQGTATGRKEGT
jgi:predicted dinucleotide-binding enzyme